MNLKSYNIGDEVRALSAPIVDAREIGFFDELEDECWELFKLYCEKFGIELSHPDCDDSVDYCIAKEIQERILEVFGNAGIQINYGNDCHEREFSKITSQIETLKSNLSKNTFSITNSGKYNALKTIGELLVARDKIYGTDLTEKCFIISDNEFYNEIGGFLGDETSLHDAEGTPLRIGDTLTFDVGTDKEYDRIVLNGLITQKMIDGKQAVKTADFCDYELINTRASAFTVNEYDCKAYYLQDVQEESTNEEMGMQL